MPIAPLTGVFTRIWQFVDRFAGGDDITRADLDAALDDFTPAINTALQLNADALSAIDFAGQGFDTKAELLSDTKLTYATGLPASVAVGQVFVVRGTGAAYEVLSSGSANPDLLTTGGIKFRYLPEARSGVIGLTFQTFALLLADTGLDYTSSDIGAIEAGQIITAAAEGFVFEVADASAVNHDWTTAGGVKLYSRPLSAAVQADRSARDHATVIANTAWGYTADRAYSVTAGDIILSRLEGYAYEVALAGASDHHFTTIGGVKLYLRPPLAATTADRVFADIATIEADTNLTLTVGRPGTIAVGAVIFAAKEGWALVVGDDLATSQDYTTAGGVKLFLQVSRFPGVVPASLVLSGQAWLDSTRDFLAYTSGGAARYLPRRNVGYVGDASATLLTATAPETVVFATPITAARTVTLPSTDTFNGQRVRVTRAVAATGAFVVSVGGLKNLSAGQWADVEHDGTSWLLTASGTLT